MTWYHGSDKEITKLRQGSWVTNHKPIAKTFGKYLYIIDIPEESVDLDILYSAVENTSELRGTILKEALVKKVLS